MRELRSHRPGHATVVAYLALFVALGGSSYAALQVTGRNIKDNSVTTRDVKNRSLLARDFRRGQLRAGPQGPQGPPGAQGPAGASPATPFARSAPLSWRLSSRLRCRMIKGDKWPTESA